LAALSSAGATTAMESWVSATPTTVGTRWARWGQAPPSAGATLLCQNRDARTPETDAGDGSTDKGLSGLAGGPPLRGLQWGGGGGDLSGKVPHLRTGKICSTFEGCCGHVGSGFGGCSAQGGGGGRVQGVGDGSAAVESTVGWIFNGGSAKRWGGGAVWRVLAGRWRMGHSYSQA